MHPGGEAWDSANTGIWGHFQHRDCVHTFLEGPLLGKLGPGLCSQGSQRTVEAVHQLKVALEHPSCVISPQPR